MALQCTCPNWIEYEEIEKGERSYLFAHGVFYKGPVFRFCPFCAKMLEEDSPQREVPFVPIEELVKQSMLQDDITYFAEKIEIMTTVPKEWLKTDENS